MGNPHDGHFAALSDTRLLHSGHARRAMCAAEYDRSAASSAVATAQPMAWAECHGSYYTVLPGADVRRRHVHRTTPV